MSAHHGTTTVRARPGQPVVAFVGSPNAGKTTLFNALTGLKSKTANYPGVTVARQEATVTIADREVLLFDLPGTYSLDPASPDEAVVAATLRGEVKGVDRPDGVIIVIDATTLGRSLLLVAEVLALNLPSAVVLTMTDELAARGGSVDVDRLALALGVPVVGVIGHRGVGVDEVGELLAHPYDWPRPVAPPAAEPIERAGWVDSITRSAVVAPEPDRRSVRIDRVLLHPVWGSLAFVAIMVLFFQAIFTLAAPAQDVIDRWFSTLAQGAVDLLPGVLGRFVGEGMIAGVGGVLVFLPQISLLFLLLAVMEKSGYLARAALLADRVMATFGLEGRSFVSMLSSFACAVPGIMSTRTIPHERTRLATMMAAPLMTCSARLPVYTLLVSSFVPNTPVFGPIRAQGLVMFGLYALGALSGLAYAGIMHLMMEGRRTASFVMELPPYRLPQPSALALRTWQGVSGFIVKAGTIILATSMALWVLLNVPSVEAPAGMSDEAVAGYQMEHSIAGSVGRAMEPVTEPLGFDWQINVALIGSLAAREVFVSTLAISTAASTEDTLPQRLQSLAGPDGSAIFSAPTVAALLVFFVYALQCFSTIAVLQRETNSWRWPAIAFGSMLILAYVGALIAHTLVRVLT